MIYHTPRRYATCLMIIMNAGYTSARKPLETHARTIPTGSPSTNADDISIICVSRRYTWCWYTTTKARYLTLASRDTLSLFGTSQLQKRGPIRTQVLVVVAGSLLTLNWRFENRNIRSRNSRSINQSRCSNRVSALSALSALYRR